MNYGVTQDSLHIIAEQAITARGTDKPDSDAVEEVMCESFEIGFAVNFLACMIHYI